jgi:hypothetical protein
LDQIMPHIDVFLYDGSAGTAKSIGHIEFEGE